MNYIKFASLAASLLLAIALGTSSSCNRTTGSLSAPAATTGGGRDAAADAVMAGTTLHVTLGSTLSSETASALDTWRGTLAQDVDTRLGSVIHAGSPVTGVITGVLGAKRGSRAMLDLSVRGLRVDGQEIALRANGEPVIAGSTRARNLGAVAGGAVAGALIGKVVGDGRNAAVGGLLGGAAAAGAVSQTRGYPVVLKAGTVLSFRVNDAVSMR